MLFGVFRRNVGKMLMVFFEISVVYLLKFDRVR